MRVPYVPHLSRAAEVLGNEDDAQLFGALAERVREGFHRAFLADGVLQPETPTGYALAIAFGLFEGPVRDGAGARLAELVKANDHRIATGFAGTPYVTDALTLTGHADVAYRLLLQTECPSWLYPVTMGATTVWERWDSKLPDGSVNPGDMTSFNHYALGSVADWMHRTLGGIAPAEPGYRRVLVAPVPGPGLDWCESTLSVPAGTISVRWEAQGDRSVRPSGSARSRHHPPARAARRGCGGGRARAGDRTRLGVMDPGRRDGRVLIGCFDDLIVARGCGDRARPSHRGRPAWVACRCA